MTEPTFPYNMRIEVEKVSKLFITQVEVSNFGRAKRTVIRTESLEDAYAQIITFRDACFVEMAAFLAPPAEIRGESGPATDEKGAQTAASLKPAEPDPLKVVAAGPEKTADEIAAENAAAIAAVEAAKAEAPPPAEPKKPRAPAAKPRQFAQT